MRIGDEVCVHGYIDEIRKDCVIIRNKGGYFGTVPEELRTAYVEVPIFEMDDPDLVEKIRREEK